MRMIMSMWGMIVTLYHGIGGCGYFDCYNNSLELFDNRGSIRNTDMSLKRKVKKMWDTKKARWVCFNIF